MKKLFFSFLAILFVVITTSCNQRSHNLRPDQKISQKVDTLIYEKVPITKPRYSCEGERLPEDKLVGMDSIPKIISLVADTVISGNKPAVVTTKTPIKRDGFDLSWLWPILGALLGAILIILALALLIFLLLWLFRQFANMTKGTTNKENVENQTIHENRQVTVLPTPGSQTKATQRTEQVHTMSIFDNQLSAGQALIGNQPIHEFTQESELRADGSLKSTIKITTKNEPKNSSEPKKEN